MTHDPINTNNLIVDFAFYLTQIKKKSKRTSTAYRADLKKFLEKEFYIKYSDLVNELNKRVNLLFDSGDYKISTKQRKISAVNSFLKFLKKQGKIHEFPPLKAPRRIKESLKIITNEEFNHLIENIPSSTYNAARDKIIFCLAYYNGLKVEEILNLKYESINGSKITFGSGNKKRFSTINTTTFNALLDYERLYPKDNLKIGTYFKNRDGEKISSRSMRRSLESWAKKAGLNSDHIKLRTMRNTYIKNKIKETKDPAKLEKILGIQKKRIHDLTSKFNL